MGRCAILSPQLLWFISYIYAIFIVEWILETNGNEIDLASVDPLTLAKGGFIVRLGRNLRNLKKENLKMRNLFIIRIVSLI